MIDEIKNHPTYGSTLPAGDTRKLVSCDDLLEELTRNRSWKYTALIMSLMLVWMGGTANIFITEFAGDWCSLNNLQALLRIIMYDIGRNVIYQEKVI